MKPSEQVYYCHLRYYDELGNISGKGGMTLAYKVKDENTGLFRLQIGKAICSEKDNFCRAYGRALAEQRIELPHKINFQGVDMNGEIMTKHTRLKEINESLATWAFDE